MKTITAHCRSNVAKSPRNFARNKSRKTISASIGPHWKRVRMDTLLQIVPKSPGGLDGVGDYALGIARKLREKFRCDTVFAAFNAKSSEVPGGFKLVPLSSLPEDASKYDRILLHYVNYGFQKRGVPFRLLSI